MLNCPFKDSGSGFDTPPPAATTSRNQTRTLTGSHYRALSTDCLLRPLSSSCRLQLWPALQEEADEDRGRNSCHGGIPPVGRCHLLAQQIKGEGFPLRGKPDLRLLGPDGRPLLPRRVRMRRSDAIGDRNHGNRCRGGGGGVLKTDSCPICVFQHPNERAALLRHPGEERHQRE